MVGWRGGGEKKDINEYVSYIQHTPPLTCVIPGVELPIKCVVFYFFKVLLLLSLLLLLILLLFVI